MALPKWLQILAQFGPQVLMFTPLAPIAPAVSAGIAEAEQMEGATGTQKLDRVVSIATLAAQAVNTQKGRVVIDPALMQGAAQQAISAAVQVANIVHRADPVTVPA